MNRLTELDLTLETIVDPTPLRVSGVHGSSGNHMRNRGEAHRSRSSWTHPLPPVNVAPRVICTPACPHACWISVNALWSWETSAAVVAGVLVMSHWKQLPRALKPDWVHSCAQTLAVPLFSHAESSVNGVLHTETQALGRAPLVSWRVPRERWNDPDRWEGSADTLAMNAASRTRVNFIFTKRGVFGGLTCERAGGKQSQGGDGGLAESRVASFILSHHPRLGLAVDIVRDGTISCPNNSDQTSALFIGCATK